MPRKLGAVSLPTPESVSLPETHSVSSHYHMFNGCVPGVGFSVDKISYHYQLHE